MTYDMEIKSEGIHSPEMSSKPSASLVISCFERTTPVLVLLPFCAARRLIPRLCAVGRIMDVYGMGDKCYGLTPLLIIVSNRIE